MCTCHECMALDLPHMYTYYTRHVIIYKTYLFFIPVKCNHPQFLISMTTTIIIPIIASRVIVPNTPPTIAAVLFPPDVEDTISMKGNSYYVECYRLGV